MHWLYTLRRLAADEDFRQGGRDMALILPGTMAWGLVTGLAMVKVLGAPLAVTMALVVYAGSAQLAALPLLAASAPFSLVVAAGLVVNLRFAIYSLQWRRHFGHLPRTRRMVLGFFAADQPMVLFMRRYPDRSPGPGQLNYFVGAAAMMWVGWIGSSMAGIFGAQWVPMNWGLGFVGVLALVGLACSLVSNGGDAVAAGVAAAAAIVAYQLPLKLHIVVAVAAAVAAGLAIETRSPGRVRGPTR